VDVDQAADQLYALPPSEFVEARDALVRQARESGDRDLAAVIAELRKPTAVGWLANRLARERADQLTDFLALAAPLREATATLSGPALRELSRQRTQLVAGLVREARRVVAGQPGPRVTEDVARGLEATLHAALADPEVAARVASGRLSGGLSYSGFGAPATPRPAAAGAAPSATAPPAKPAKKMTAVERREAGRAKLEIELAQARAAAREAEDDRDVAAVASAAAGTAYDDAARRVEALQVELRAVQDHLAQAERAREVARAERNRAAATSQATERGADRARTAANHLQARVEALSPSPSVVNGTH
jgi:hypothetical protein